MERRSLAPCCAYMNRYLRSVTLIATLLLGLAAPSDAKVALGWKPPRVALTGGASWGGPQRFSASLGVLFPRVGPGLVFEGEVGQDGWSLGAGKGYRSPDTPSGFDVEGRFTSTRENPIGGAPSSRYVGVEAAAMLRPIRLRLGLHARVSGGSTHPVLVSWALGLGF
jgi:hypothetical protein